VRRGSVAQLVAIGIVCGGVAALVAIFIPWLPDPASRQAGRIDFVFWFVTVICIAIFALVAAVIIYALFKFRAPPGDDTDGPPIHGHTGLEIVWTAVPAALVTAISIVSAIVLAKNDHLPSASAANSNPLKPLVVEVTGQQFAWSFKYTGFGGLTAASLRLPLDAPVKLRITSLDVTHSFWVPEFRQKMDAVPGSWTTLAITPDKLGTYPIECTELCGLGHALMNSSAQVMPKQQFLSWAKSQQKQLGGGSTSGSGKAVFTANACSSCHTFTPAGANAKIGPDLDNLKQEAQQAGQPLEQFIRQSIVDPNAYVAPGFPKNIMPSTFSSLPKSQLDALVTYLAQGAK
jgi:cytochrome c oxidase subunit 2